MKLCKNLTIFEGPDGAGKSTVALEYAKETDAQYVHFSSLPMVSSSLPRMYVEAMIPALLGLRNVVFDRSWLSEIPYGTVLRNSVDRVGPESTRILERLAMRCGAVVVKCDPGVEVCLANYRTRKDLELLDNEEQLRTIHQLYDQCETDLFTVPYNYLFQNVVGIKSDLRINHPVDLQSAGNINGRFAIVCDYYDERSDTDSFYQWPFSSFDKDSLSQWLTDVMIKNDLSESDFVWLNSNQLINEFLPMYKYELVFGLGSEVCSNLRKMNIAHIKVTHPKHQKYNGDIYDYNFIQLLKVISAQ